jgi:DNA-binding IclR family transcriptional regulator
MSGKMAAETSEPTPVRDDRPALDRAVSAPSPAVAHAVRIMEYLARSKTEASLSQIARDLGLSKSSCLNILTSLVSTSMLTRDGVGPRYRLGPKLLELARAAQRSTSKRSLIRSEIGPLLEESRVICLIVQQLARNDGFVVIDKIEPRSLTANERPPSPTVGNVYPLFSPAYGGAYLATLADEEIAELVIESGHPVEEYYFLDRLPRIRELGFAWSDHDYHGYEDVKAVAIMLPNSDPQLLICLVANQYSAVPSSIETWGEELVAAGHRIARAMTSS